MCNSYGNREASNATVLFRGGFINSKIYTSQIWVPEILVEIALVTDKTHSLSEAFH
jgi:hypothetical protein